MMSKSDHSDADQNATVPPKSKEEGRIDSDLTTGPDRAKQVDVIPRCATLEAMTEINRLLQGVELATLAPFDTINVRTVNSHYRILLLDPATGRALLNGGQQITEALEARIVGSSFGGSILRTGWIGVGLRMEACANDTYIRTSPIQSLCVETRTSLEAA